MVTWWAWPAFFILVLHVSCFIFLLSHICILYRSQQSPIHHAGLHYLLYFYPLLILSILVNTLLTSPGSFTQDSQIPVCPIHNFSKWVTGIFSLVTGDDVIRDSYLIDKGGENSAMVSIMQKIHALFIKWYVFSNFRGDSCNGGEAHARLNKMRTRERKEEYRK